MLLGGVVESFREDDIDGDYEGSGSHRKDYGHREHDSPPTLEALSLIGRPRSRSDESAMISLDTWRENVSSPLVEDVSSERAATFVDSAYGTGAGSHLSNVQATEKVVVEQNRQEFDDARTEYSDLSTTQTIVSNYVEELAQDLSYLLDDSDYESEMVEELCVSLPVLLQRFALNIGHESDTKEAREVMYYVHRYRQ